jgi:hypothetical protein
VAIKACKDVAFSNGGQYFAAVNGITLSLYNTYTCECLGNLRGHNGKVRATLQHQTQRIHALGCLAFNLKSHALHAHRLL